MKTTATLKQAIAIGSLIAISSSTAWAHSNHDHSTLPLTWKFSKNMATRIQSDLSAENFAGFLGINSVEQKRFDHYGLKVGNKFNSKLDGMNLTIERTSSGIKILNPSKFSRAANNEQVPIRPAQNARPVSLNPKAHSGHDHSYVPFEWVFGEKTQAKLLKRVQMDNTGFVGITSFELDMLDRYEIKVGQSFHTEIGGQDYIVERASSGVKVVKANGDEA